MIQRRQWEEELVHDDVSGTEEAEHAEIQGRRVPDRQFPHIRLLIRVCPRISRVGTQGGEVSHGRSVHLGLRLDSMRVRGRGLHFYIGPMQSVLPVMSSGEECDC